MISGSGLDRAHKVDLHTQKQVLQMQKVHERTGQDSTVLTQHCGQHAIIVTENNQEEVREIASVWTIWAQCQGYKYRNCPSVYEKTLSFLYPEVAL